MTVDAQPIHCELQMLLNVNHDHSSSISSSAESTINTEKNRLLKSAYPKVWNAGWILLGDAYIYEAVALKKVHPARPWDNRHHHRRHSHGLCYSESGISTITEHATVSLSEYRYDKKALMMDLINRHVWQRCKCQRRRSYKDSIFRISVR